MDKKGEDTVPNIKKKNIGKQAAIFREHSLLVQTGLQCTYTAAILFILTACASQSGPSSFMWLKSVAALIGIPGIILLTFAFLTAVRDISRSMDTLDLELLSSYPNFHFSRARRRWIHLLLSRERRPSLIERLAQSGQDLRTRFAEWCSKLTTKGDTTVMHEAIDDASHTEPKAIEEDASDPAA